MVPVICAVETACAERHVLTAEISRIAATTSVIHRLIANSLMWALYQEFISASCGRRETTAHSDEYGEPFESDDGPAMAASGKRGRNADAFLRHRARHCRLSPDSPAFDEIVDQLSALASLGHA